MFLDPDEIKHFPVRYHLAMYPGLRAKSCGIYHTTLLDRPSTNVMRWMCSIRFCVWVETV